LARRNFKRVLPLLVVLAGSVVADVGWLSYLLGWREGAYTWVHSVALVPFLLFLGISLTLGWGAIVVLRKDK
jgi:hypothetical protein